jgi:hypothetical protein
MACYLFERCRIPDPYAHSSCCRVGPRHAQRYVVGLFCVAPLGYIPHTR